MQKERRQLPDCRLPQGELGRIETRHGGLAVGGDRKDCPELVSPGPVKGARETKLPASTASSRREFTVFHNLDMHRFERRIGRCVQSLDSSRWGDGGAAFGRDLGAA